MTEARAYFFDQIVEFAETQLVSNKGNPETVPGTTISILRNENTYQIAQFFFLLEELRLYDPVKFSKFLDRHNEDIEALLSNNKKLVSQGLMSNRQRIGESKFSEGHKAKILDCIFNQEIRLDQSDLAKIMYAFMSPESCRKTLVAMAQGGLILRKGHMQVFVWSNGVVEEIFRNHLKMMLQISCRAELGA